MFVPRADFDALVRLVEALLAEPGNLRHETALRDWLARERARRRPDG